MQFLKKFLKTVVGLGFLLLVFYLMFGRSSSFLNGTSPVVTGVQYFKNFDAWNVVFMILFLGPTLSLFLLYNYLVDIFYKWIGRKYPKFDFINSEWADFAFQLPGAVVLLVITFLLGSNIYVQVAGSKYKTENISSLEPKPVVLLGTSKMLSSGRGENRYYTYRIEKGVELYKEGKVLFFILSGDGLGEGHDKGTYNEIRDMRNDLIAAGVPPEKIQADSLGLRTVDSSLRLISVFGVNDVVYISQGFHTTRAVVQSSAYGIKATAVDAKGSATIKMWLKEALASRPGLVVDVFFAKTQPRVSGTDNGIVETREKLEINDNRGVIFLLCLFAVPVVGFMGYGAYRASSGIERRKIVVKYSLGTLAFSLVATVLAVTLYKTLPIDVKIKFLEQVVETVAANVGVKTEKMAIKEENYNKLVAERRVESSNQNASITPEIKEPVPVEEKQDNQQAFNTSQPSQTPEVKEQDPEPEKKKEVVEEEDNPFNTASPDEQEETVTKKETVAERKYFKVKVNSSQTVDHDGTIMLRLAEPVTIGTKQYSKDFIFEGKTVVFNGRFIIVSDAFDGGSGIEVKNFENGKEGSPIQARHQGKRKEEIVLGEGESLTFGIL